MPAERDTEIDFDLIHSQQALQRAFIDAATLGLGGDRQVTEIAMSMNPPLIVEHNLTTVPDTGYVEVLEEYLSRVYGRDDVQVAGFKVRKDYTEIRVGIEDWDLREEQVSVYIPEVIDNMYAERRYAPVVYILHDLEGNPEGVTNELWVATTSFSNSSDQLNVERFRTKVLDVPPKVYSAIAGILAAEFDPSRINVKVENDHTISDLMRVSAESRGFKGKV